MTPGTLELFLGFVNAAMPTESAHVLEAQRADIADVRTLVAMDARNVPVQL